MAAHGGRPGLSRRKRISAIAGIYCFGEENDAEECLRLMMGKLTHRGVDGAAGWQSGSLALGCLGAGQSAVLPLSHEDEALTADLRLDGRAQLLQRLKVARSEPLDDGELLLQCFRQRGVACAEWLEGDFAFALWDKSKRRLFCARDRLGVKPFYYHHSPGRFFAFASEIKALLALPQISRELNEGRIADYLASLFVDKEQTFYQRIKRLPPAHWLLVEPGRLRQERYWSPAGRRLDGRRPELEEEFSRLFFSAVGDRCEGARAPGFLLSGGLDSSSIALAAQRLKPDKTLPTFSAIFPTLPACDESAFIAAVVAAGGGFKPHAVQGDRLLALSTWQEALGLQDQPFHAPNLFMHLALYAQASQRGVRTIFDGLDGDTTVGHGWHRLTDLTNEKRYPTLAGELIWLAARQGRRTPELLEHFVLRPWARQSRWASALAGRQPRVAAYDPLVGEEIARRTAIAERWQAAASARLGLNSGELDRASIDAPLVPFVLEVADQAAAAFGLEPRYPFFDYRLIEFCLSLPSEQKLSRGLSRSIMRRSLGDLLPDKIARRPGKADLSGNFSRALLADRVFVEKTLADNRERLAPYVNQAVLAASSREFFSRGNSSPAAGLRVWKAATLALWLGAVEGG